LQKVGANWNSILEVPVEQYLNLNQFIFNGGQESSASVQMRQISLHRSAHFEGANAKREYARHIQAKHRGELTESESNLGLQQCNLKTCGKVTYMGEKAAKKHQEGCAAQTQEVQAKRRKEIEKSRPVGAALAAASTKRKWQPQSSKRTHAWT
jgi:hypothetical protein